MVRTQTDIWAASASRIIIGGFFAVSGANTLVNFSSAIAQAELAGIPVSGLTVFFAAIAKLVLGIMIAVKLHTKFASLLLSIYVAVSTLLFYHPLAWAENPFTEVVFVRNLAIFGALLSLYAHSRGVTLLRGNEARRLGKHLPKEEFEKLKASQSQ